MLEYIRNKQLHIINSISTNFIRKKYLKKLISNNRLVGLIGQRGVGKTTLLLQYLKLNYKFGEYLYFSADDVYLSDTSIYKIAEEFVRLNGKVIVIDEIHKYNNWAGELKTIYDSFPNLIIRFSGSSMLNILNEKYDLSRRLVSVIVDTLSFKEYFELSQNLQLDSFSLEDILKNHIDISVELISKYPNLYKEFQNYLKYGCYPFFVEDTEEFKNKLFNAIDKIINEDIPSLNKIDYNHLFIFKKLIAKIIYSKVPYKVNVAKLCEEFNISHPTMANYFEILNKSKIIKPIKKYSKTISKKPNKLLFANTNILYTLSDEFMITPEIGTIRETFFSSCFENIYYSDIGDFRVDNYIFEIGGKNKSFKQIKDIKNSYLAIDTDYSMTQNKIPLWLFGFLY